MVRADDVLGGKSSKCVQREEPNYFSAIISSQFVDGITVSASPHLPDVSRVHRLHVRRGGPGGTLQSTGFSTAGPPWTWRARLEPVAKAQEDCQSLINGGHLFPGKLTKYAPDPPLVD